MFGGGVGLKADATVTAVGEMTETQNKIEQHKELWAGRGPWLILIPTERLSLYDPDGYKQRFDDPQ